MYRSSNFYSLGAALLVLAAAPPAHAVRNGAVDQVNHYANVAGGVFIQPLVNAPPWDQIPIPWIGGSGVLIHPRVVLTAGHTVEALELVLAAGNSLDAVRTSVGPDAYDPDTWVEIEAFLKHPNYRSLLSGGIPPGLDMNDVGVLILKEPVLHVAPAQLPEPHLLDMLLDAGELTRQPNPTPFTLVGYGLADPNDVRADGLRRVGTLGFLNLRSNRLDCLGSLQGYSGTLQGDSGGPIFWTDPDSGEEHLVATVTGWEQLETHSRIDLPNVLEWLQEVMDLVD